MVRQRPARVPALLHRVPRPSSTGIGATELFHLQDRLDVPVLAPGGAALAAGPVAAAGALPPRAVAGPVPLPAPGRAASPPCGPRWRCAASTPTIRRSTRSPSAPGWPTTASRANAVAHLWELIARPDPQPHRRRGGPRPGREGVPHRPARPGRRRRHRLGPGPARRGPRRARPAPRSNAAGVEVVTGAAVERTRRRRRRATVRLTGPHAHRRRRRRWPPPTTRPPRCCPPGALAPGVDPDRLGTSPVVDVHLVLDRRVTDLAVRRGGRQPRAVRVRPDRGRRGRPAGQVLAVSLSAADGRPRRPGRRCWWSRWSAPSARCCPPSGTPPCVDSFVTKERAATFRAVPGSAAHRPPAGTRVPGRLPGRRVDGHRLAGHDGGRRAQRQRRGRRHRSTAAARPRRWPSDGTAAGRARSGAHQIMPALRARRRRACRPELRRVERVPPRLDRRRRPAGRGRRRRQARAGGAGPAVGRRRRRRRVGRRARRGRRRAGAQLLAACTTT